MFGSQPYTSLFMQNFWGFSGQVSPQSSCSHSRWGASERPRCGQSPDAATPANLVGPRSPGSRCDVMARRSHVGAQMRLSPSRLQSRNSARSSASRARDLGVLHDVPTEGRTRVGIDLLNNRPLTVAGGADDRIPQVVPVELGLSLPELFCSSPLSSRRSFASRALRSTKRR